MLGLFFPKEVQDEEDQSLLHLQRQIEVISAKNRQRLAGAAQRHANRVRKRYVQKVKQAQLRREASKADSQKQKNSVRKKKSDNTSARKLSIGSATEGQAGAGHRTDSHATGATSSGRGQASAEKNNNDDDETPMDTTLPGGQTLQWTLSISGKTIQTLSIS